MSMCNTDVIKTKLKNYKYAYAIWTDSADFIIGKELNNEDRLLEVRCFDENGEFWARRDYPCGDFKAREITKENESKDYIDEEQYLDIDEKLSDRAGNIIRATGGGKYRLPEDATNAVKLLVRYYYTFDDDGIARKTDSRLLGFKPKEGK